ncbi:MAG: nitrogen regulation protein NR(II) [Nitrospinales bacterium]
MKKNQTQKPPVPKGKRKPEPLRRPRLPSQTAPATPDGDLYRNIVYSLIEGILLVSNELKIVRGNLAIEEMFGQSHDFFEGHPLTDLFPNQPSVLDKIRATICDGSSFCDVECLGYRKVKGATFPVHLTLSPYLGSSASIEGCVVLVRDMSLLKDLEEATRQSDHMSTLGVLALGMAHEIKNPLGGIRGSAQLLRSELNNPEFREYLEVVINEVDRINRMVKHMLDFAQPQKLKLEETNIHEILEEIITLEKNTLTAKRCEFIQDYDPSLPLIEADEDKLKQVFLNLIRNAAEASPDGGKIWVITRISNEYPRKSLSHGSTEMHIVVEITDCGPGISEEEQKNLFTPFYTTKKKGSGLGLPISLKIIEDHLGKIRIVSRKSAGTAVQVFIPVRQERPRGKRD